MDMQKIIDAIAVLEKKLDAMPKDNTEKIEEMEKQLGALQDEFRRNVQRQAEGTKAAPLTLGQEFVKSDAYKAFLRHDKAKAVFTKSATSPVTSMEVKQQVAGIVAAPVVLTVEDAIPAVETTSNLIEFTVEKAWTDNAAAVAEGAEKPESAAEFGKDSEKVQTVAHFIRITKQLAEDNVALAAYIDMRMEKGVDKEVERQIINGDKEDDELNGLLVAGNYTPHGLTQGEKETNLDLIRKCAMVIRVAGYSPTIILMNPIDYDAILGLKTADGAYLIGNPTAATAPRLWGLPVVQSGAVAAGTFLVCDMTQAVIYNRQGVTIEMFEQDADNVTKNLITVRAERRLALTNEAKLAFVGGALWGATSGS